MAWVHNASPEINATSQWPTIVAVCITLTLIMVVTVALRGYVRGFMLKTIGGDDWVILFSAVCSIIYSGLCIGQTRWGLGLDLELRPKVDINQLAIINFVGRPFHMAGITGFKVALCISFLRILKQSNNIYKKVVWIVLIACVTGHLVGTLVLLFQCDPVHKSWEPLTPGVCLPNDTTFYGLAAMTIFFDCIIFLLPIPILSQLQINLRRKIALIGVFTLGLFTTVCSIMRMVQIITISETGNSTMLVLWGTIEMNVGIILTCLPTLTPLFTYFREKSTARYGYSGRIGQTHEHNLSLKVLKSGTASRITETSSERWKDRDSLDKSSQQGIIGPESSLDHQASNLGLDAKGITATTRVEVHISDAIVDDRSHFERQSRWGGV